MAVPIVVAAGMKDFPLSLFISVQKSFVFLSRSFRARLSAWAFDFDALHLRKACLKAALVHCMFRRSTPCLGLPL